MATSRDLVTLAEVRATGLTAAMAPDADVERGITLASVYAETRCGVPFRAVTRTAADPLLVDGTGRRELWLQVPIIAVTEVGSQDASGNQTAYDASTWLAYARDALGEQDHQNPRLERRGGRVWPDGQQNIYLVGTFGWVEDDPDNPGTSRAPYGVRRAVLLLVVNDYAWDLTDEDRQEDRLRRWIKTEKTEGHSYTLSDLAHSRGPSGLKEADRELLAHMRPRFVPVRRRTSIPATRAWWNA